MKWILENPQVVIIAIFVIGSLVKNVLESRTGRNQEVDPDEEDERPFVPIDQDKSYRKVERSGPPPLTRHGGGPPPLPMAAAIAAEEAAAALKHQQDLAERLRQIRATKAETTGGAAATRARVAAVRSAPKPLLQSPSSIRSRLRDPAEVRRAFVMREILDPPVGLR